MPRELRSKNQAKPPTPPVPPPAMPEPGKKAANGKKAAKGKKAGKKVVEEESDDGGAASEEEGPRRSKRKKAAAPDPPSPPPPPGKKSKAPPPPPPPPAKKKPAKKSAGKAGKGKSKAPPPAESDVDEEDADEEEDGDDDDDDDDDDVEIAPPPKKGKAAGKKSAAPPKKPAGNKKHPDPEDVDDMFAPGKHAPKGSKGKGKKVAWTDDESDGDARSKRFAKKRGEQEEAMETDDIVSPMRLPGKHAPEGPPSPPMVKKIKIDFSHFDINRKPVLDENFIPSFAHKILVTAMKDEPFPLHYFSDEALVYDSSPAAARAAPGQPPALTAHEDRMSHAEWSKWSARFMAAIRKYDYLPWIINMFVEHFGRIATTPDVESAWALWRDYDVTIRRTVKGEPPNIGPKDDKIWGHCVGRQNTRTTMELDEAVAAARHAGPSRARTAGSTSTGGSVAGASTSAPREPFLKYDRCILCGNKSHRFDKAKKEAASCTPAWLVWSSDRRIYVKPASTRGICYAWNSIGKCKRDGCRFANHGHHCSLCGAQDHGACHCTTVAR